MKKSFYACILWAAAMTSGCIASSKWYHDTANENQFNRDFNICQSFATQKTPRPQVRQPQIKTYPGNSSFNDPYAGAAQAQVNKWMSGNTFIDDLDYQQNKQQVFSGCMYERGYYLAPAQN